MKEIKIGMKLKEPMMKTNKNKPILIGNLHIHNYDKSNRVYSVHGICPTILAHGQGTMGHQINILEEKHDE